LRLRVVDAAVDADDNGELLCPSTELVMLLRLLMMMVSSVSAASATTSTRISRSWAQQEEVPILWHIRRRFQVLGTGAQQEEVQQVTTRASPGLQVRASSSGGA
jgi:hypothetical protein